VSDGARLAHYPEPFARLIEALQRLPGIGPKSAQRMTFFLLKRPIDEVRELSESIMAVKEKITYCRTCFNVTDEDPCRICAEPCYWDLRASWEAEWPGACRQASI